MTSGRDLDRYWTCPIPGEQVLSPNLLTSKPQNEMYIYFTDLTGRDHDVEPEMSGADVGTENT